MKNAPHPPISPAHEPAQAGHPMAPAITPVPGWPQEPWDTEIPNERIVELYGTPIPGDLFAACVAAGFESLLAQKTERPAGEEGLAFKALVQDESDEVLESAVLTAQACAYQLAGSKTLSIMVAARFMCLVLMHRLGDLFPLFPKEGGTCEGPTPHWSFVAAAAKLDLLGDADDVGFDPDQMRFLAMCCADFDNPWSLDYDEPVH